MRVLLAFLLLCAAAFGQAPSPYVAQMTSPVRGLSAQEVDDLLNGRGMGQARMAELQSYPGPRHVIELKDKLGLSETAAARVQASFGRMDEEARRLGREIVEQEKQLSAAFAAGTLTPAVLASRGERLGRLYGRLRAVHLRAHLEVRPLLTAEQVARYNELRGYTSAMPASHQHDPSMHHD